MKATFHFFSFSLTCMYIYTLMYVFDPFLSWNFCQKHHLCQINPFSGHYLPRKKQPKILFRGGSRIFFRRGCNRLLLYFNTNKPHSFFLQNTSCIRKPQVISGRGGGVHPLHPPPRSAPVILKLSSVLKFLLDAKLQLLLFGHVENAKF